MGWDHLLFVIGLLWLVKGWRPLVKTITAFTIAHSVTLTVATLGWFSLPSAPVEAIIALSIVFVAVEAVKNKNSSYSSFAIRSPWVVAFSFGLLHGFGFAGALSEIAIAPNDIPISLLFFNVGVELGQLMFLPFVYLISYVTEQLCRYLNTRLGTNPWQVLWGLSRYGVGTMAMFWFLERTLS